MNVPAANVYWYDAHTVGMNDDGRFVLQWRDYTDHSARAIFSDATGALPSTAVTMSARTFGDYGYDSRRPRKASWRASSGRI